MSKKTLKIVLSALFAAIVCVLTFFPKLPIPATGGYIHLGDSICLAASWLLGPVFGSLAAGVGSALADAIGGYWFYVPATFIIKTLAYFAAGLLFRNFKNRMPKTAALLVSAVVGELIMVLGYFLFEWAFLDSAFAAAISGVPANIIQGCAGIGVGIVVTDIIFKNKQTGKYFKD